MVTKTSGFDIRLSVKDLAQFRTALEAAGRDGEAMLNRLDAGAKRVSSGGFRAASVASRELEGGLRAATARLGPMGGLLAALGPAGLAAGAGIVAVGAALTKMVGASLELEKQQGKLTALLGATRQASGQTLASIEELSVSIGRSTLASVKDVRDAAGVLLTFKSVAGDAFGRTLKVAQDLSVVMGGDLSAATARLGKALEDPERNLSSLNESGISFTKSQTEMIKKMKESGDEAGALSKILGVIEGQVGGAAAGQAGGLAGAFHKMNENIGIYIERASEATGITKALTTTMSGLAEIASRSVDLLDPRTQARGLTNRLNELRAGTGLAGGFPILDVLTGGLLGAPDRDAEEKSVVERLQKIGPRVAPLRRGGEQAAVAQDIAQKQRLAEADADRARKEAIKDAERLKKQQEESFKLTVAQAIQYDKDREAASQRAQAIIKEEEQQAAARAKIIADLEREPKLLALSSTERRVQVELTRAQEAAGKALSESEKQRVRTAVEQTAAIEARQRAAEAAQRETERRIQVSTDRIVDFGADAFDRIFDKGTASFKDLGDEMVSIMRRTFAQIVAEAVLRPIVVPIAAAFLGGGAAPALGSSPGAGAFGGGGGIGSLFGNGGGLLKAAFPNGDFSLSALGSLFGGAPTVGSITSAGSIGAFTSEAALAGSGLAGGGLSLSGFLGGAGLGFGAGTLLNSLFGGNQTGGTIGSGVGAAAGALIGSVVPGIGTILGGLIGGGGGGLLGGLFGPGKSVGPVSAANLRPRAGRLTFGGVGTDNGGDPALGRTLGQAVIDAVAAIAGAVGGRTLSGPSIDIGRIESKGFFGGLTSQSPAQGGNPPFFADQGQAVTAAVRAFLKQASFGSELDAIVRKSAQIRDNLAEIGADIDLAKVFQRGTGAANGLAEVVAKLRDDLTAAARRAAELNLPAGQVPGGLRSLADGALGGLLEPLRGARDALALSTTSPLAPGEQIALARSRFDEVLGKARGGDLTAIGALPGAGSELIGVSSRFLAPSGGAFADVFATVTGALNETIARIEGQRDTLLGDATAAFSAAIAAQTKTLSDGNAQIVKAITDNTAAFVRVRDDLVRADVLQRFAATDRGR